MDEEEPPMLVGQSVRDLLWAFRRTLGDDVVAAGIATAPEEARDAYTTTTPVGWVSYEHVRAVHSATADAAGTTMEDMLERSAAGR